MQHIFAQCAQRIVAWNRHALRRPANGQSRARPQTRGRRIGAGIALLALIQLTLAALWTQTPTDFQALSLGPQAVFAQEDDEVNAEDDETVQLAQTPELTLDKAYTGFVDEDESGDLSADDIISYTFTITNTGNVTVNAIALEDTLLDLSEAECGEDTLTPTATGSCVYTYTLSLEDMEAGSIENEATATGVAPDDSAVTASASASVELPQLPGLSLEKAFGGYIDLDDDGELGLNDVITYTFAITNTGNVGLENVALTDALLELEDIVCGETELAPGASANCEHIYTVTQDDMDAGEVYNVASVSAAVVESDDASENDEESENGAADE